MENKLTSLFRPTKKDILFDTAMSAVGSIKAFLTLKNESGEPMDLERAIFHKIYPNDPKSPAIYWLDKDQYVIYYPENSKPYSHRFEEKCKFIEVLSGKLYDRNNDNFRLFKGDKLKVYPKDNYAPYTKEEPCYIRVCVGDCSSLFDRVCG